MSMLEAGQKSDPEIQEKRPSSKEMPRNIVSYINSNNINSVVKKAINKILREKPDDPISALAA
jgi:hypothetical protein